MHRLHTGISCLVSRAQRVVGRRGSGARFQKLFVLRSE